jgi:hypothetical protein
MSLVILDIKNNEKGKYLLDFLRQIDFLEIKEGVSMTVMRQEEEEEDNETFEDVLMSAPVLSDEELQNIENINF